MSADTKAYGPQVRWVNPLRIHTRHRPNGWTASYRLRDGDASVSECETKAQAIAELHHFLRMRVARKDGQWVEVDETDDEPTLSARAWAALRRLFCGHNETTLWRESATFPNGDSTTWTAKHACQRCGKDMLR